MVEITGEQARRFRLFAHHLDRAYDPAETLAAAGACGLQNSPPGAWETALHNRIPSLSRGAMGRLLEEERRLLQAWSFRGAPVVFPTAESDVFLSALTAQPGEEWIYTHGIGLALDFLQLPFDELLSWLGQVMPGLEGTVIQSKTALDETLAQWMLPLLPQAKRALWLHPSLYGSPNKQTVGGAVVSFLLRPCALRGQVVFGHREGVSPTFTGYRYWVGHPLVKGEAPEKRLARKYLHCYGPADSGGLKAWLGCSPAQGERIWGSLREELEPVIFQGRQRYILSADRPLLGEPPSPVRAVRLLGAHDPYLGLQDRATLLADGKKQRLVWQTIANPGVILRQGEIIGLWKARKKGEALTISLDLWGNEQIPRRELEALAEDYAQFQQLRLDQIICQP